MLNLSVSQVVRPYLDVLWFGPSASADDCNAYVRNMVQDADDGATIITRGVVGPGAGVEEERAARAATAAIMLAANGKTFVGVSSGWSSSDWRWWPFYDAPLGASDMR
jgi:hypothetical protein